MSAAAAAEPRGGLGGTYIYLPTIGKYGSRNSSSAPDPAGYKLTALSQRSPNPIAVFKGPTSKRREAGRERGEDMENGREKRDGTARKEKEKGKGSKVPNLINPTLITDPQLS